MSQDHNDEIDLGVVFDKIKQTWNNILIFIYGLIRFVFKHWIVIILLIIGGAVAGHYWQKATPAEKKATLIIQNNFNSTSYVYDAPETLQKKSRQGDGPFLKKYGFDKIEGAVVEIEVEPIVNILELMEKTDNTGRSFEEYMTQTDFEEDVLLSEIFYTEYNYHRITLTTTGEANNAFLQQVLVFLNSNELFQGVKAITIAEVKSRIKNHEKSIKDIEGVFEAYVDSNEITPNAGQFYFKNNENNNLHQLLTEKQTIMEDIEALKVQLLKNENVVTIINDPSLSYAFSTLDNKRLFLPIGLVMLYFFVFAMMSFYRHIKSLAERKQSE